MYCNINQLLTASNWLSEINDNNFEEVALSLFQYQATQNEVYKKYIDALNIYPDKIDSVLKIPFLPISFFKTHTISDFSPQEASIIFESSGTTATVNSKHYVKDENIYLNSLMHTFQYFYGSPEYYTFLFLLPSYMERKNSSLVYMAEYLMAKSQSEKSGFYLNEWEQLAIVLKEQNKLGRKTILLGVTFALLDFAEQFPMDLSSIIVMETGGMKGRRQEWTRDEVHSFLKKQWNLSSIHSEYGMTELLSQAYSKADGIFKSPPYLKALLRDESDPLLTYSEGSGCLNIIDLANVHSCAFIATEDIGKIGENGSFEVLGRLDYSALRGCSLMVL